MIFDNLSLLAALSLLAFSHKRYAAITFVVFLEFALHRAVYFIGVESTQLLNSAWLLVGYMAIQSACIGLLYKFKSHFSIAFLIFANLLYNFFTILQYANITNIDFYSYYQQVVGLIMILELLYLIGVSNFVVNKWNRNGKLNHSNSANLLRVRSGISNRGLS